MNTLVRTPWLLALLLLVPLLQSCGGNGSGGMIAPPPPPLATPGFSVSVQARQIPLEIQGVSQGQSIGIQASGGFGGSVAVSLQDLPAGVSASLPFPIQIGAGKAASFSLFATSTATAGTSAVTVVCTRGSLTDSTQFSLQLTPAGSFEISLTASQISVAPGSSKMDRRRAQVRRCDAVCGWIRRGVV